jgi:peptidoglycan/xylan/chitin deacetylase (PgdA/CDA1 family)
MDLKRWIKVAAAKTVGRWTAPFTPARSVVLCYHSISVEKSSLATPPDLFERHLRWLKEHCRVVPFGSIFDTFMAGEGELAAVAITFDDGYANNYEQAFPLLRKYDLPATFFLTVGLLEKQPGVVARLRVRTQGGSQDLRPLTWPQVLEMRRGGMEIGAHSLTHRKLARLNREDVEVELKRSKQVIEQHLGEPVTLMSYPYGVPGRHFRSEITDMVTEAGYEFAASILFKGVQPRCSKLNVPRFPADHDSLDTLRDKVHGAWDLVGLWQEKGPLWMARVLSPRQFRA